MDEQGFVQFASVANLAHRARVPETAAAEAVERLESPDKNSSDPDHEGRRIERVPGGWMILNAEKYRELVTRAVAQEKTRQRVARFRAKQHVTNSNADVTLANVSVTPSEALADIEASAVTRAVAKPPRERNELIDALAAVEGIPLGEISSAVGARLAKALAIIKETTPAVTREEVAARGERLKLHHQGAACTAMALANHWGKCSSAPDGNGSGKRVPGPTWRD